MQEPHVTSKYPTAPEPHQNFRPLPTKTLDPITIIQ
jgi:hypothetical protein